ncbi:hypothetical protein AVEN_119566-1 [Araneus ventricosus]|uniref:Uncharacterized protein n=1 Tax=Araneus ventricosus TaxID=182803 RepID=A0A4Y2A5K5_ARAVE|nr:hypothetical protein AVEN_119566-1 [Araneus ventricosus]
MGMGDTCSEFAIMGVGDACDENCDYGCETCAVRMVIMGVRDVCSDNCSLGSVKWWCCEACRMKGDIRCGKLWLTRVEEWNELLVMSEVKKVWV